VLARLRYTPIVGFSVAPVRTVARLRRTRDLPARLVESPAVEPRQARPARVATGTP